MSLLYPLFLTGLAAAGVPIVLHMIRRHTRKEQWFGSLMFLRPSRPRLQSRRKIEHLLLLILRCLILALVAWGFARPFFGRTEPSAPPAGIHRRVILLDTSASMRREGLWPQAIARAESVLKDLPGEERLCIMAFDQEARTVIGFEQSQSLAPDRRSVVARQRFSEITPTWYPTNLDEALVAAARALEEDQLRDPVLAAGTQEIILISDMQQGARLDRLGAFAWPQNLFVTVEPVSSPRTTNAGLTLLAGQEFDAGPDYDAPARVRVQNSADAERAQFVLRWRQEPSENPDGSLEVYVAPGTSTVFELPAAAGQLDRITLAGDDHPFDNRCFVRANPRRRVDILYLADEDLQDAGGMGFYLKEALASGRRWDLRLQMHSPGTSLADLEWGRVGFVIVAGEPSPENVGVLKNQLQLGKGVLVVMRTAQMTGCVFALAGGDPGDPPEGREADVDGYAMLSELDFTHPVLRPFDDPRFGDFTPIHFWKYRRLRSEDLPAARVLARFDSGAAAWLTLPVGAGQLAVMTSGWHPADSQLARSTKFVPLLYSFLEFGGAIRNRSAAHTVGERIALAGDVAEAGSEWLLHRPDGSRVGLDRDRQAYFQPDEPGMYTLEANGQKRIYAVNLAARESQTAPQSAETLESLGIPLKPQRATLPAEVLQARRQRADWATLEAQQKIWRWILLAALIVLLAEMVLAGRLAGRSTETQGVTS
ncbi:MAG: BatA domain-containing protein [Sedimentisphaerales bacterium]|nr:BatA domain-containing protein [Sedimentisphaerales bacterium]